MPMSVQSNTVDKTGLGLPPNAKLTTSNHPVLAHKLTILRDKNTESNRFRHVLREITFYLGYEATRDLTTIPKKIETPLQEHVGSELAERVALVPILRAGLGMVDAMLDLLPNAKVHHIGMYRSNDSLLPIQYYNKLPKTCDCDVAIILEPMIATAGTINATVAILKTWGVKKIKICSTMASIDGLKNLLGAHPNVEIYIAAIDQALSQTGFILPGLGDVGDRQFSTTAHALPKKRQREETPQENKIEK